jgi:hypothetical protein
MMTVMDYNNMQDWAADCNGEGRERAVRDDGECGVVMMAWHQKMVVADNGSKGGQ